jgi:hypothetical protein
MAIGGARPSIRSSVTRLIARLKYETVVFDDAEPLFTAGDT